MVEKSELPITLIGKDFACSPAIVISAVCTGPQTMPSVKGKHSTMGLPLESVCCGSAIVSTDDNILSPEDPVSTKIPPMVWQLVVLPGTHTVTLVNAPSTYGAFVGGPAAGPVSTVIACTFAVAEPEPPLLLLLPLPPPLQPPVAANAVIANAPAKPNERIACNRNRFIGCPLHALPPATFAARTLFPDTTACVPRVLPPVQPARSAGDRGRGGAPAPLAPLACTAQNRRPGAAASPDASDLATKLQTPFRLARHIPSPLRQSTPESRAT